MKSYHVFLQSPVGLVELGYDNTKTGESELDSLRRIGERFRVNHTRATIKPADEDSFFSHVLTFHSIPVSRW